LQEMKDALASHYKLVNNIDCSDTINWNGGAGFAPVGTDINSVFFNGSLQGQNYNITNLYIKNSTLRFIGLFGYAINTTINEVHLWNISISNGGGSATGVSIGGMVGAFDDNGSISNSSVQGNVTSKGGGGGAPQYTGGLAGYIWANKHVPTIYNSSFTGNISGTGSVGVGGLTGWSDGIINYSYANVKLNSTSNGVGGLVGVNDVDGADTGVIDNSYSVGNVSVIGAASIRTGGLVGDNNGKIYNSYSTVNVSGNQDVGGLTGENAGNILNSYSCGNVDGVGSNSGGLIGFAVSAGKTNYTYSAGVVKGGTVVGGFVGQDGTGAGGPSYYNFSFYDYEVDGGDYNDTGDSGNVSGIYANTTVQMKKKDTYNTLGWDFNNVWQIAEDYSYPYLKWQTTPACGIPVPTSTSTPISGGSGGTPINLLSGFNVNPQKMFVVLKPGESKTECFTVTSIGTLSITITLNTLGQIPPFTTLTNSVLNVPVAQSKTSCAIFSADDLDIPKNYTGQIRVSRTLTQIKNIDVELEIINITILNATNISYVLPVGVLGQLPGDPIWVLPVGVVGFLPGDPIWVLPVGIESAALGEFIDENLVKGVVFISLWILLLLLLIIYLAVRKFIKLQEHLQGYESREDKFEAVERLKRNLLRKKSNFFEKIVDKGTIYLSEKALESKVGELKKLVVRPEILSAELRERYNSGAWLYLHRDYENALKEFERCVESDNKFWQGWQGIGSCYLAQRKIREAIIAFEKSLSINPNNPKLVELLRKYKKGK
ncbi:MAG: tetratricopeptide repeat protein, partial [Nanoarchaeota archaeon]|nr:tetratricopeptide repeat protein [Nanoarchaeota archaeon]